MRDGVLDILVAIWIEWRKERIRKKQDRKRQVQEPITVDISPGVTVRKLLPFYCPRCSSQVRHDFVFPNSMSEKDVVALTAKNDPATMTAHAISVCVVCPQCAWTHVAKDPYPYR